MLSSETAPGAIVSADERSLALHAAVARKVLVDPRVIDRARRKLDEWIDRGGQSTPLWKRWREILAGSPEDIAAFLVSRTAEAAWLRKASPFAGVLEPRERWNILRSLRRPAITHAMNRRQLEHVIRAACEIADDDELIVIGSQAVLGQFPDAPEELLVSMEVDVSPTLRS